MTLPCEVCRCVEPVAARRRRPFEGAPLCCLSCDVAIRTGVYPRACGAALRERLDSWRRAEIEARAMELDEAQ